MPDGKHIFISYSRADADVAAAVAQSLQRAGVDIFFDEIRLQPGVSLTGQLAEGLDQAAGLVAIISAGSVSSDWVMWELKAVRDRDIRVVPFQKDDCDWPTQLKDLLGDPLRIAGDDFDYAVGLIPKLFPEFRGSPSGDSEKLFPLSKEEEDCPCVKFFKGTLQSAIQWCAFGKVAVVVPTSESVNLRGRVTGSLLSDLGLSVDDVVPSKRPISSRDVSPLDVTKDGYDGPFLMASTVFNPSGSPRAEDQWRSATAILDYCDRNGFSVVITPPLGTGTFGWPVRQAVVNWFYGANRWVRQRTSVTAKSVWPVLCIPGPSDQTVCSYYFDALGDDTLKRFDSQQLSVKVRWQGQGQESEWLSVRDDVLLGSIGSKEFPELPRTRFSHGAKLIDRRSGEPFRYGPDTPLSKTIFADGDILDVE